MEIKKQVEESQNQLQILKNEKKRGKKRKSEMTAEESPVKIKKSKTQKNVETEKSRMIETPGARRLDDMMAQIDSAISETLEPRKASNTPSKFAARHR